MMCPARYAHRIIRRGALVAASFAYGKPVEKQALRPPSDFIDCTREEQFVQLRPTGNVSQNPASMLIGPLAWKRRQDGTEDERTYAEGNADHRLDTAQHVPQDGIIADTLVQLCEVLLYSDKSDDCIISVEKAMRMGPRYPPWFLGYAGWAHYLKGDYEMAIELASGSRPIIGSASYAALDRAEEARELAAKVLRSSPTLTLTCLRSTQPYRNKAQLERLLDHLRKAGVPGS
jgi:hypothetical protein